MLATVTACPGVNHTAAYHSRDEIPPNGDVFHPSGNDVIENAVFVFIFTLVQPSRCLLAFRAYRDVTYMSDTTTPHRDMKNT